MQFGEDPSISHVANRFMGTGLLRAPLPGKLSRPLRSAMVRGWGGGLRAGRSDTELGLSADRGGSSAFGRVRVREVEPRRHALRASSYLRPVRGPSRSGWEPQ